MATILTENELRSAIECQNIIQGGDIRCAEGVKYDFRLSNQILKAKFGRPIDARKLTQSEAADLIIEPNEVVFVLSEERLALPSDVFAQLSPKRKISQAGILTLGGLTIDPGYNGRLLVGLLNFSSTQFTLKPGKKLIAASFFRLTESELSEFRVSTERLDDFPDELVDVMQKYRPVGTGFLIEGLKKLEGEIDNIKQELRDYDDWRTRLDRHDEQIRNLIRGLEAEKLERETGQDKFSIAIEKLNKNFAQIKGGAFVFYFLFAVILIPFLIQYLPKVINILR